MLNNTIIQGKNSYSWEGVESNKTWSIKITHGVNLLTDAITEALKDFKENIFFNDTNSSYWFMDFKINDVWVEGFKINPVTMEMQIGLYQ